jgi:BirA family biotin operon repressor/biotin-[acetyl-CoA-carboxylase] ligase
MKFDLNLFKSLLSERNFLNSIEYFEEIGSTNTYLKNSSDINRKLVIADFQTAGRGRFDRKWVSNKGENLTFSLGFERFEVKLLTSLNFLIPVTLINSIEQLYNVQIELKWPNDLLINGKKFCGILIENSIDQNGHAKVIIGIGINCNQLEFPEEISTRATSLRLVLGYEIIREKLLAKFIDDLSINWESFQSYPIAFYNEYKKKCLSIGKQIAVSFNNEIFTGIFDDISEEGELILKTELREMKFKSGEITIIKE